MNRPKLSIGMACHDDFEGVYFSVQALRLHRPELMRDAELVIVDNNPNSSHGSMLLGLLSQWLIPEARAQTGNRNGSIGSIQYVQYTDVGGTAAPRNKVFEVATGDVVICMDSHVLFPPGSIEALLDHVADVPDTNNLFSGPMLYDDLKQYADHFQNVWGSDQMWGRWGRAWQRPVPWGRDPLPLVEVREVVGTGLTSFHDVMTGEQVSLPAIGYAGHETVLQSMGWTNPSAPFEIGAMGLGVFACRREAWLGFNKEFRGFGGEEWYIHAKYRRAGRRCICLPEFRWLHRFGRPNGTTYKSSLYDKARNYVIGHRELGLDVGIVRAQFVGSGKLNEEHWARLMSADPPPLEAAPAQCGGCGVPADMTLEDWYKRAVEAKTDINEHVPTLRRLAASCDHVTEFGTRAAVSTVALLAAQPKAMRAWDIRPSAEAVELKKRQGKTDFEFKVGDSKTVDIEETDLLFIDTVHTAAQVLAELDNTAGRGKVRRYIVLHDTEAPFGETGEDGGPGVLPAVRGFVWKHPEWTVKEHHRNNHGLTVLSRLPEDRKELPGRARMAWNMVKASAKHALNGGRFLPLALAEERLKVCAVCEYRAGEQCSVCGCWLRQVPDDAPVKAGEPGKVFYPTEACPIGRWSPQPDAGEAMTPEQVKALIDGGEQDQTGA